MAKSSCVNHPSEQMIAILRQDYLEICHGAGKGRRPYCAAMLLNMFEHWQNVKFGAIEDFNRQPEEVKYQPTKWIYFTEVAMAQEQLLGMFGVSMVSECIDWLVEVEFILTRRNPKKGYDRTKQFTMNLNKIHAVLQTVTEKQRMHSLNLTNGIVESNETIPKVSSKESLKDSLGSENPEPRPGENSFVPSQSAIPYTGQLESLEHHRAMLGSKRKSETVPVFNGDDELQLPLKPETVGGVGLSSKQSVESEKVPPPRGYGNWYYIGDSDSDVGSMCIENGCDNQAQWNHPQVAPMCEQHYGEFIAGEADDIAPAAPDKIEWRRMEKDTAASCCECSNSAAWDWSGQVYCEWHHNELTSKVMVSQPLTEPSQLKPDKPKRACSLKQLANDARVEALGIAWEIEAQGDDYAFYLKIAKALNKAGIENSEFEKYVKHWRKEFKDKNYNKGKLTLPSLTAKARPSDYVAQRDKPQAIPYSVNADPAVWGEQDE